MINFPFSIINYLYCELISICLNNAARKFSRFSAGQSRSAASDMADKISRASPSVSKLRVAKSDTRSRDDA